MKIRSSNAIALLLLIPAIATAGTPSGQNYSWALSPAFGISVAGAALWGYGLQAELAITERETLIGAFQYTGMGGASPQTLSGSLFLAGVDHHFALAETGALLGARAGAASVTLLNPGTFLSTSLAFAAGAVAGYDLDLGNGVRAGPELSYLWMTHAQATSLAEACIRFRFRF